MRWLVLLFALALGSCVTEPTSPPVERIPFELVGEKVFLAGLLDGKPVSVQFDTGAETTVISLQAARRLGIVADGYSTNEGAGGKALAPVSRAHRLTIGSLTIRPTLTHLDVGDYKGRQRDIVVGYDLLASSVVTINHDLNQLELRAPRRFSPQGQDPVPITMNGKSVIVPGSIRLSDGQDIKGHFLMDNGNELPLLVSTPFAQRHNLKERVGRTARGGITGSDGNEIVTYRAVLPSVTFAGYSLERFPVRLAEAKSGVLADVRIDGLLGNPVLRKFNITYDVRRKLTYWQRNRHFAEAVH